MEVECEVGEPIPLWIDQVTSAGEAPYPNLVPVRPKGPASGKRACVIVCPGGGYARRADHEGVPISQWLCSLGLAAPVLNYRVAPHRHPLPLGDAQRAIRLVRARANEWGIDPTRVGVLGFSAGGHVATSAAVIQEPVSIHPPDAVDEHSSRPDALIACYAVISFLQQRHPNCTTNLLGPEPSQELLEAVSLEKHISPRTPPAFIWHTADDGAVPVRHSLMLAEGLAQHKVPFELHVFPRGSHGLGMAPKNPHVAQWTTLCGRWLKEIGFVAKAP